MQSSQQEARPVRKDTSAALDIKGSVFTLTVLHLKNPDLDAMQEDLRERLAQAPRFFERAPVVIDVKAVRDDALDFAALARMLRANALVPVGVRHATPEQQEAAVAAGLAVMQGGSKPEPLPSEKTVPQTEIPAKAAREISAAEPASRNAAITTRIVRQPVRSGQQIYAKGGDLILLAPVNAGAEVLADGNIHVYAPLRGRALAGVGGDVSARIFAHCLEAELVAVAGHYRIFEQQPAADVYGKPVQVYLEDERLMIAPLF